jgi:hypothetical protein
LNKKVLIKETGAIFLAIVLVLGTIALTVPSFSVEAQATSDREKDYNNDYEDKKSYDKDDYKSEFSSYGKYDRDDDKDSKSVSIKKVKCNNINVNLNGINVDFGFPNNGPVTDPVAVTQEEEDDDDEESNSIENENDKSDEGREGEFDSDTNSRIVCINNNNNIVVGEEEPELTCEECFTENLNDVELETIIQILIILDLNDLEGLCEALSDPTLSNQQKIVGLISLLFASGVEDEDTILEILECLEELDLVIVPEELPIPT